jgi:membrane-associated phospholipid phosphatase
VKRTLLILLCAATLCANAQVAGTAKKNLGDTLKKDLFTAPDTVKMLHSKTLALIVPAVLVGYGFASFAVKPIRNFDYYVAGRLESATPNFHTSAESYFLFTPIVLVYGLNLVGVEGENRFIDRTAILGLAGGILELTDFSLKHATHRLRPNGVDYYSFPSAHTGAAFMGAEFLAQEYGDQSPVYTVIGYTVAVTTGIFRMANRDHWFSDVVAGAGFGILSAKAAYFVYPYLRSKLTHTSKTGKTTMIMPSFQNGAPGLSFAAQL